MTDEQARNLRADAEWSCRVYSDHPSVLRLVTGIVQLLDERENGRKLAEDRFDAEMSELRDGLASLSRQAYSDRLTASLLAARVDGVARRVDALESSAP